MARVRRTERLRPDAGPVESGYDADYDSGYDYGEYDGYGGYSGYGGEPATPATGGRRGRVRSAPPARWHAGADLGLVVLRVALAVAATGHGAQVMFGVFGGPGLSGYAQFLADHGYAQPATLAGLSAIVELGGGVLVLVGLFTPMAAAALVAVLANAAAVAWPGGFFPGPGGPGAETAFVLAALAAALVLTGAGRLALDPMFPLLRRPHLVGPPLLLLGLAAAVAVRVLLHTG
jgi:putative oxidoreductase